MYEIVNSGNVNLLNPDQEELPPEIDLNKIWVKLLEEFSIASNNNAYSTLLIDIKNAELIRNKVVTCMAALELLRRNVQSEKAIEVLLYFGIKFISVEDTERRINREISSLKKFDSEVKNSKEKEYVNFWKLVVDIEEILKRPISINIDNINARYWIELRNQAKEIIKAKKNGKR